VAAMTEINIAIRRKSFAAHAEPVIGKFELQLQSAEFVCLVGPSGCGKTTLLNIIAGLDDDYQGQITLGGKQSRPKIGYVFQNPRLLPWCTVRENIDLALEDASSAENVDVLLEMMGLSAMQQAYPERLSLGMSRRVAIIRAFAVNPDVLLLDEPFVSLDPPTARQARSLLLELWQQKPHTVLFVTHDLREAIALADKLVFLSAGPMTIVSEIAVPIARSERDDEQAVEAFRRRLIDDYPAIKGLL
jgi:ABC-type nitrate/sulfonate/bicarbonate transport system ATPase subunit